MIKARWMKDEIMQVVRNYNGSFLGWYEYDPKELCGIWRWAYEPIGNDR